jgi:hypothetical protein
MPGVDPAHWLLRLTAAEWLAAADTELEHAEQALRRRAARPGVTHARRAAGMAWNAVLVVLAAAPSGGTSAEDRAAALAAPPIARFGRSYMEHVVALAGAADLPALLRAAAAALRDTPPLPPALITLGKPDLRALDAARAIVSDARARVTAAAT